MIKPSEMLEETEDSFLYNYVSKFNSLEKRGNDKVLPLLIKRFLETKPEGGVALCSKA